MYRIMNSVSSVFLHSLTAFLNVSITSYTQFFSHNVALEKLLRYIKKEAWCQGSDFSGDNDQFRQGSSRTCFCVMIADRPIKTCFFENLQPPRVTPEILKCEIDNYRK